MPESSSSTRWSKHDSFPRSLDTYGYGSGKASGSANDNDMLAPPRPTSWGRRLSQLSTVSEWSKNTLALLQAANPNPDGSIFARHNERNSGSHLNAENYLNGEWKAFEALGFDDLPEKTEEKSRRLSRRQSEGKLTALPTINESLPPLPPLPPDLQKLDLDRGPQAEKADSTLDPDPDPHDPKNWRPSQKWIHVVIISWISFVAYVRHFSLCIYPSVIDPVCRSAGSLLPAPSAPEITQDLRINSEAVASFVTSVFTLGLALGPLVMLPLSNVYGRLRVYHVSNICLAIFTLACGLSKTYQQLLVFRAFAGALGTACLAVGAGTVTDLYQVGKSSRAMAVWASGPLLAPFIGAIAGGGITHHLGWKWQFFILAAVAAFNTLLGVVILRETRLPLESNVLPQLSPTTQIRMSIIRPIKLLCQNPIVGGISLYIGTFHGMLILICVSIPFTLSTRYGFSDQGTGASYLAFAIGLVLGLPVTGAVSSLATKRQRQRTVPEDRISVIALLAGSVMAAAGLIMYGWTAQRDVQWIVPLLGLVIFATAFMPLTLFAQAYLAQAFPTSPASLMASMAVIRSLMTALFPLGGIAIYRRLGLGWGSTLLAGIVLVFVLIPLVCAVFGEKLRKRLKLNS